MTIPSPVLTSLFSRNISLARSWVSVINGLTLGFHSSAGSGGWSSWKISSTGVIVPWPFPFSTPTVGEMMTVADAGKVMPPKSTWFEPKLLSGLFVHLLE